MLGLSSRGAVSVYRARYDDFRKPVIDLGKGRPMLWLTRRRGGVAGSAGVTQP